MHGQTALTANTRHETSLYALLKCGNGIRMRMNTMRAIFPCEIFNQQHADRFYGLFFLLICFLSFKPEIYRRDGEQKRIHHHLETLLLSAASR